MIARPDGPAVRALGPPTAGTLDPCASCMPLGQDVWTPSPCGLRSPPPAPPLSQYPPPWAIAKVTGLVFIVWSFVDSADAT